MKKINVDKFMSLLNIALEEKLTGDYSVHLVFSGDHIRLLAPEFIVEFLINETMTKRLLLNPTPRAVDIQYVYETILTAFIKENNKKIKALQDTNKKLNDLIA